MADLYTTTESTDANLTGILTADNSTSSTESDSAVMTGIITASDSASTSTSEVATLATINTGSGSIRSPSGGVIRRVIATRSGLTSADYTITSGVSVQVKAGTAITASGSGTATCIIVKTGVTATDGVIKWITTGTTVMTSGQSYTPSAFTYTINQPT